MMPEVQVGVAVQGSVDDEVGQGDGRRRPEEHRLDDRDEAVVVGVERVVQDPGLVGHVEDGCDAVVDEGVPELVEVRMGEGPTVDRGGGDHGQAHAGRVEILQLPAQPVGVPKGQVGHGMQPSGPLLDHRGAPPVPGRHVRREGAERAGQRPLPEEAEVREQDGFVDPHGIEAPDPGPRLPEVGGQRLVVDVVGRLPRPAPTVQLADRRGVPRDLDVGRPDPATGPGQPGMTEVVVDDGQRVVPPGRLDVVGPERAGLVEVLVDIDDAHAVTPLRRRSSSG